jgi:hypothetical protein
LAQRDLDQVLIRLQLNVQTAGADIAPAVLFAADSEASIASKYQCLSSPAREGELGGAISPVFVGNPAPGFPSRAAKGGAPGMTLHNDTAVFQFLFLPAFQLLSLPAKDNQITCSNHFGVFTVVL